MESTQHPPFMRLAIAAILLSAATGCASKKHIQLPPSALSPSLLESYSLDELLIHHEGLRLKPYTDAVGKLTVGVGRNLEDTGITREEALILLENDIQRASRQLDQSLPWWKSLSKTRQKVLVSMVFNLGMSRLLGFRDMLAALQDGDYSAAADHMLASKWASQVGVRAVELAYMMENG
jgi:lysozyme